MEGFEPATPANSVPFALWVPSGAADRLRLGGPITRQASMGGVFSPTIPHGVGAFSLRAGKGTPSSLRD